MPEEALAELRNDFWNPGIEATYQEVMTVTGSLSEQIAHTSESALGMQTTVFFDVDVLASWWTYVSRNGIV